jgi:hypothetical protein
MKDTLTHLHLICEDWKRELSFYKDEMTILKNRLLEVASKNTGKEILISVEHFENKFRIIGIHIDEMLHDVKAKNKSLLDEAAEKLNYISVKMKETDENLEELMHSTRTDFTATKKEFYTFLSKVL